MTTGSSDPCLEEEEEDEEEEDEEEEEEEEGNERCGPGNISSLLCLIAPLYTHHKREPVFAKIKKKKKPPPHPPPKRIKAGYIEPYRRAIDHRSRSLCRVIDTASQAPLSTIKVF